MKNETIRNIVKKTQCSLPKTNKYNEENRIFNTIVEYYLDNSFILKGEKEKTKINSQIQFYLYDHLITKYFKFLCENGYSVESEFLRDIFYDYTKKDKKERINILKKFKEVL